MKTDRYNLEDLLADVEHAGRDERRQQELGAMIDRIAAAESGKQRGFWWWSGRVAAAACILFFVSTAVRIWFIPTDGGQPMVAEVKEVPVLPAAVDPTTVVTTIAAPVRQRPHARPQVIAETPVVVEEYVAEEVITLEPVEADSDTVPAYIILDDFAPDAEPVVQAVETEPVAEPVAVAAEPAKPARRRSIFSLFRPAEPSLMEGTTLALLQL